MVTKIYSVRFDPDLMARVDAQELGRSEFIRDAVEAALGGSSVSEPVPLKKNSIVPPAKGAGRQADAASVLGLIRGKRLTSRQVEADMGWLGLRYANAEKLLLSSGAAVLADGFLLAT